MTNDTKNSFCDALIIGAGPIGLTLALELERYGLKCRIIDKCATATDKSKALVVWSRSLELLSQAGVADDFVASGMWAKGARIFGGGKELVHVPFHRDDTAYPLPLMIPQCETERVLGENLTKRGLQVDRQCELVEFKHTNDDPFSPVIATLQHADGSTETVTCNWLCGCDGAHSTVRKQLGFEFAGNFEPNDWMLADTYLDGDVPNDEISGYWHRDGVLILFPFAPGRFRIIADMGIAPSTGKPTEPTLADAQRVLDERGPAGIKLHDPVWLAGFRIHERKVKEYSHGNVFLSGDAAHIHSPAGGQGMNTGMQDAFNLAWKIAFVHHGKARRELLASYSEERGEVGEMVLRNAGIFTRVATLRNPITQFMRNHLMALAGKFSAVQERAISNLCELDIHYPHSPLNADDAGNAWSSARPVGDRLPDADMSCSHGKPIRLLDAIRDAGYTLLLLPATNDMATTEGMLTSSRHVTENYQSTIKTVVILREGPAPANTQPDVAAILVDEHQEIRNRLGLENTAIALVRPDGYIAFRGNASSWRKLSDYLAKWLIASGAVAELPIFRAPELV
jgi:2-polyprenyl-6-methoxyphenol hydroxylase-like FAD-dependent oxidoreductase